jgi:signal transduction histidine kinase/DNA-binding response OmpR family regulator
MKQLLLSLLLAIITLTTYGQTGFFFPSDRFSSGLINDICQDKYGYIWIATENGLNKFDGYRFTTYLSHPDDSTTLGSNIVTKLYCDKKGQLWVGTRIGLSRYDYTTDSFKNYDFEPKTKPRVINFLERKNGEFLVGTSGRGLFRLAGSVFKKVPDGYTTESGNWYFNQMLEDQKGNFWKCGYGEEITMKDNKGVHQFFIYQGIVAQFAKINDDILVICQHGISRYHQGKMNKADIDLSALGGDNVVISSAYQSKQGDIYIGTRGDGLFVLKKGCQKVERIECQLSGLDLNTAKIWSISEDQLGNIWLGCQSKGLVMIPKIQPLFSSWSFASQGYRLSSTITSICKGDHGIIWTIVQGNGVYGFDQRGHIVAHPDSPPSAEFIYRDKQGRYWIGSDKALYAYDPVTGRSQHHISFVCDKLNDITEIGDGRLFISTYSRGFCIYNPKDHSIKHYLSTQHNPQKGALHNNWILAMMPDSKGYIWMATSAGITCFDPQKDYFRPYGWDNLLDGMMCYSLCETKNGNILIGTDQGLYEYHPGAQKAERFKYDDALTNKVIGKIVEANNGDIWCATSMGIWHFDLQRKIFIGHVRGNGIATKEYINCIGMHTSDDMIYFANNDGLTVFNSTKVTASLQALPPLRLTGFFIAGNAITEGPVIETDTYEVSYLDNNITLEFSLLDFANPDNIIYEYKINGTQWIQESEGENSIQLSHLQPGTYKIEARALSAGVYSSIKTITVVVTPPWYQSTWAYTLYFLAAIAFILGIGWSLRRKAHMKMDEEKMKFLINATHDIRSPLTLIMGPLAKLKSITTNSEQQEYIDTIDRNAQRLMLLVNQILDERRIDKKQMRIHCRETNLVEFISGICKLYQYNATQRHITFLFEHDKKHVLAWIDRINFDKVISNLLSNAFKYTFDGGEVKVILREREEDIEIVVADSGVGIKDEEADKLFDRFFQGRNADDLGMKGTGIGLNLSKSITLMHGGQIKAMNRKDGVHGACFCVTLPKGHAHLKPDQILTDTPAREVLSSGALPKTAFKQFHILVVDDDSEIANYIISELGSHYKFDHAPNGKEALKMLLSRQFDLVISDVMMPEMDGITMLKRIKDNVQISQIPVIMLTSKAEVEHKLEGLKSGADAYIAKPFNMEELHIQIDNLIDNVRRLRGKFSGAAQQEKRVENIQIKSNDDALMERVMKCINTNMSDPDFNIDALASEVGISRAQLHRRMKEITGISSGKFLRNLRMDQAARLLREGKVNIAQVADKVGYADQAHFSTAFKTHFGMSPSEYVNQDNA